MARWTQRPLERFLAKVNKTPAGCWLWVGAKDQKGYGHFFVDGRFIKAHRFAYQTFVGPIPDGLQMDHLCAVTSCVNPSHLEAVTPKENRRRGRKFSRHWGTTHCLRGHLFDAENTRVSYPTDRLTPRRTCRQCHREQAARSRARKVVL